MARKQAAKGDEQSEAQALGRAGGAVTIRLTKYAPYYTESHALVIGINNYVHAGHLEYAKGDAEEFANTLTAQLGFPSSNVTLLLDRKATRNAILAKYLEYQQESIDVDSRLVFFFAGHGGLGPAPGAKLGS